MPKGNKAFITTIVIIIVIAAAIFTQTATFKRLWKSFNSNLENGLSRTVTVYDDNGKILKEWSGKIDIQDSSYGNKVLFDLNGKRKVVYNAIVIVEEE